MLAALLGIVLESGMQPVNTGNVAPLQPDPPVDEPEVLMLDGEVLTFDNEVLVI